MLVLRFGGLTITHNPRREILYNPPGGANILIYMPNKKSPTAQSDVPRMKLPPPGKLASKSAKRYYILRFDT